MDDSEIEDVNQSEIDHCYTEVPLSVQTNKLKGLLSHTSNNIKSIVEEDDESVAFVENKKVVSFENKLENNISTE